MIVYVTPELNALPRSGGELRTARLLEALARRAPVTALVLGDVDDVAALQRRTGATVETWPRRMSTWRRREVAAVQRVPLPVAGLWSPAAARRVELLAAGGGVVVLDHLRTASYRPRRAPCVLSLHNHESRLLEELPAPEGGLRRAERRWDLWSTRSLERRLLADPDVLCVLVSGQDHRTLRPARAVVVPNGADLPADPPALPEQGTVLFVGSLDYEPNREGLRWWSEQVWPASGPGREPVTVVGRGGAAALGALATHPALRVLGQVDDVGPHLAAARTVVVPLLSGGGSRLKVLEALAWGRPVVSTSKGVEGLDLLPGRDVLVADDGAAFAAAVARVRSDSGVASGLAGAGQRVASRYDWQRVGEAFADAVLGQT